ncbi:tripartite tricarboxylate transporter substrate binding protein [Bradyrhizobium sp. Leo121]|uniref:Bug family tripartite tricarboxylate transporter substrate binding protein n=1 Tax=Bradyrhizobium sp. Leo121 TaxID=1571195 RepID=UPI00102A236F|nr:tripartite tricarboxylate transporter substrate binding protein [Bradyrhizobium sp. Leo121]RZN35804.1 tripartite tricarboxylate transporter substrate binding protein [Bradyrhizobium sp. Leo121]
MKTGTWTAIGAALFSLWVGAIHAEEWTPKKPIEIVVGFAPGGGSDQAARIIAAAAQESFPVPLVVTNKPGAAGVLAAQQVARSKPDGYTLLVAGGSETTSVPAHREVPYDPDKDFTSIIRLTNNPFFFIVAANSPFKTIEDVIAAAKAKPGEISQANTGLGGLTHSAGVLLERAAGVKLKHVPYQGGSPAIQALIAGQIDIALGATEEIEGQVQANTIRILASTGAERSSHYPDVPTLKEKGYDVVCTNMKGLVGPAGLPPDVVKYLHDRFHQAMDRDTWRKFAERVGEPSNYRNAAEFASAQQEQLTRIKAALKQ